MDFLGLEAFLAVIHTQSFSKAAQQLNLAQSTVSKRLQVLEHSLGVTLFERKKGNHPIQLTEAGERLIEPAQRLRVMQMELEHLHLAAPEYRLTIGSLGSLNYAVFPRLFHALSKHRPRLTLKVINSHSPDLYDLLETRRIDVGFTLLKREHPLISVEPYHAEPMVGLCLAGSPYLDKKTIHPNELEQENELYANCGTAYESWHTQWWGSPHKGKIELDTPPLVFSFFSNPDQWAGVPLSVAERVHLEVPSRYGIFFFSPAPPERICYKITHKRMKAGTQAAIRLIDTYFLGRKDGSSHES